MKTVKFSAFGDVDQVTADIYGDPTNPAVILLHGGGQTRHAWDDSAARFAEEGYFVVNLDLRGHGESGWSPSSSYEIHNFVEDLKAVLEQLPAIRKNQQLPYIVGASMGGITGIVAIGNSETELAQAIVLVDVVPRINPEGADKIRGFMQAHPEGFASLDEASDVVAEYLSHRPRPADSSGLARNLRLGEDGRYYWHWDPNFVNREVDPSIDHLQEIMDNAAKNVQIPTLLVKGSHSEIVDDEGVEEFLKVLPHGEIVDVKGARHMVAGDKNSAFQQAVLQFLKTH